MTETRKNIIVRYLLPVTRRLQAILEQINAKGNNIFGLSKGFRVSSLLSTVLTAQDFFRASSIVKSVLSELSLLRARF